MKIVFFYLLTFFASPLFAKDIYLAIGEAHSFPSHELQKLVIHKKGLLTIYDHKNSVTITGKKLGKTKLKIGKNIYWIHILHRKKYRTLRTLKKWIQGKRGPEIEVKNKRVTLKGRLLRVDDLFDLSNHCDVTCEYINQLTMDDSIRKEFEERISELLKRNNLTMGKIAHSPTLNIGFPKKLKENNAQLKNLLNPYGIGINFDSYTFSQGQTIEIQVYIAHLKKSFLRQWGVQWPNQLSATVAPHQAPSLGSIQIALNALEATGNGSLLASPTLVTESGKEAIFHSGGEFPIQTRSAFNNSVDWKRYGLSLKTTPQGNAQHNLNVKIDLEISTLDHSQAVNGVPGLNRSHLNTEVTMEKPRPILLSGFFQKGSEQARSGLPWLAQIPLFSPLFSTGQIHNTEYELVFVLLPRYYEND